MKKNLVWTFILSAYWAILIKLMVFKDIPTIKVGSVIFRLGGTEPRNHPVNLVPFKTIFLYLLDKKGSFISSINLIGNILLLVPVGFMIPFVYKNITWKKTVVIAVLSGLLIEGMQAVLNIGIFDIDDLILNGLGVIIGYWVYIVFAGREMKSQV